MAEAPKDEAFETKQNTPNQEETLEHKNVEKKMSNLELDAQSDNQSQNVVIQIVRAETKIPRNERPTNMQMNDENLGINPKLMKP